MTKTRLGVFAAPSDHAKMFRDGQLVNGSQRANWDFRSALHRHGTFDEYHCFVPGDFKPYNLSDARFRVFPFDRLNACLRRFHYTAFHHGSLTLKSRLLLERSRRSRNVFPVTSVSYTISYSYMMAKTFAPYCRYAMHSFDRVFACSRAVQKSIAYYLAQAANSGASDESALARAYPGDVRVVPLGVDVDSLRNAKIPRRQAKAELGFPRDSRVLLWFGRISAGTKADLLPLIQVFASLPERERKRCILVLAGGGDEHEGRSLYSHRLKTIERYIRENHLQDRIRFVHKPSDEWKAKAYSAADVFVSLSDNIQESFGLTVVEAQAMGLPVIVSDWDGYRDIVRHEATGFLIPTYWCRDTHLDKLSRCKKIECYHFRQAQAVAVDLPCFRTSLLALLQNPELRKQLGHRAAIHARQYDWSQVFRRYEALWTGLHDESRKLTSRLGLDGLRDLRPSLPKPPKKANPRFTYFDGYKHFATDIVDESWAIAPGDIKSLLIGATSGNLSEHLLVRLLEWMDVHCRKDQRVRLGRMVADLADYVETHNSHSSREEEVVRHVMWLFKQGVLHCRPGKKSVDSPL